MKPDVCQTALNSLRYILTHMTFSNLPTDKRRLLERERMACLTHLEDAEQAYHKNKQCPQCPVKRDV